MSYALTFLILLSQIGLPVHMHYCKGMLESVSVFFKQECDDHQEIADLPACCQQIAASHCVENNGNCCNDQVKVLTQEITCVAPQFMSLDIAAIDFVAPAEPGIALCAEVHSPSRINSTGSDTGPPIYILHQALIFYA